MGIRIGQMVCSNWKSVCNTEKVDSIKIAHLTDFEHF